MASSWPPDEFVCSVCLEVLRDPTTLPCGHTYCMPCIKKHWDQGASTNCYSCPQCRKKFNPRPSLSRSTVLAEALEKLSQRSRQQTEPSSPVYVTVLPSLPTSQDGSSTAEKGLYPQLPVFSPRLCQEHQQPLDLYCRDEKVFVCEDCGLYKHKGHQVVRPHEERREKQQEVVQMQAEILRRIQEKEKDLQDVPKALEVYQDQMQMFKNDIKETIGELVKSVELLGSQVEEVVLQAHEAFSESRKEAHLSRLQQEVSQLRKKDQELRSLSCTPDDVRFLEELGTLSAQGLGGSEEVFDPQFEAMKSGVKAKLGRMTDRLQDLNKDILAQIFRIVNDANSARRMSNGHETNGGPTYMSAASAEGPPLPLRPPGMARSATVASPGHGRSDVPPPLPERPPAMMRAATLPAQKPTTNRLANPQPKTRVEMLKFRFGPTLDQNTAYRHIRISDGDRKATLRAEVVDASEHPDRFLYWRQVLCREPLAGSPYYWEVEWTGHKVTVGVTYRELERAASDNSSRLGYNSFSWGLNWSGSAFSLWHNGKETPLAGSKAHRVGIYLDQQEGLLAFYKVSHGKAELIHSLRENFTGPLFPGFRFWTGVGATITIPELE
ncbi:finTRIM family, member 86 [Sardina pilchardus]|uniref:finTRIM family, member 86 n=1 Tax=Sardina pilchardus TaxID=27697 RepID=UPI002E12558D